MGLEMALAAIFALCNIILNISMLIYLYKVFKEMKDQSRTHQIFSEVFQRMDNISRENTEGLCEIIIHKSDFLADRLSHIHRRQNTIANMIKDDRERLREHVEKVDRLHDIAEGLGSKFLDKD